MNPELNYQESEVEKVEQKPSVLNSVTPLSKYLAMILFILLPFIGGFVGYSYAPVKVVEVERVAVQKVYSTDSDSDPVINDILGESKTVEPDSYEWCIINSGEDKTPSYNAPKVCILDNRVYESRCVNNEKYFVIQDDKSDEDDVNIVVKRKTPQRQNFPCEYSVELDDFVIKSDRTDYLLALEGDHLLIDSGTGPSPRGLTIYDLIKRQVVYESVYSLPVLIQNNIVEYWRASSEEVTESNCKYLNEYQQSGLGAGIERYVSLNLLTMEETDLGEARCSSRQ